MKKIIFMIFITLIAGIGNVYYGLTNEGKEKKKDIVQESIVQAENAEKNQENENKATENTNEQRGNAIKEEASNTEKQNETVYEKNTDKENEVKKSTQIQTDNEQVKTPKSTTTAKKVVQNNKCNTQTIDLDKESKSSKKVDLSKFSYYEKQSDGSYKAFLVDTTEMNKLKGLIDNAIKGFGYKNIKIIEDSSLAKDGTMYFTANKTNVENAVYDSEGFNIYYYAVKEYHISPNGTESYFQTRSYIRVK